MITFLIVNICKDVYSRVSESYYFFDIVDRLLIRYRFEAIVREKIDSYKSIMYILGVRVIVFKADVCKSFEYSFFFLRHVPRSHKI